MKVEQDLFQLRQGAVKLQGRVQSAVQLIEQQHF